jgi:hypothetical protein
VVLVLNQLNQEIQEIMELGIQEEQHLMAVHMDIKVVEVEVLAQLGNQALIIK